MPMRAGSRSLLSMQTLRLALPRLHVAQQQVKREAKRFNVVDCGRRFGKTLLGQDLAVHPILQGYPVGWFAPTYKILLEAWQVLTNTLQPVTRRVSQQEKRIELITGGVLEAWSLDNPDAGRSRKYKRAIMDEWSMVTKARETWQQAIRPTLTDLEGDAWFLGTPKGRNHFWELFVLGQDAGLPDWKSWQMSTYANPFIKSSEIDAARAEVPERVFRQEYLAEFLEDGAGVFRRVREAAILEPSDPQPGKTYVGGIDWGRTNDYTVLRIIEVGSAKEVFMDRFSQTEFNTQLNRFKTAHARYNVAAWIAEQNSIGMPLVEQLQYEGYPVQAFVTTNATKAQIIDALALAFERGELQILNDAIGIAELEAYEMERLPSGLIRYSAPDGIHDDTVMRLALAWYGASQPRGIPVDFV